MISRWLLLPLRVMFGLVILISELARPIYAPLVRSRPSPASRISLRSLAASQG